MHIYIYIYIYVNIMRGKNDATTYPDKPVASFFPLMIFILLCFNVLSTVPRENRLADFLYIYIYIYPLMSAKCCGSRAKYT